MEFDKIRSAEPLSVDTVSALVNEVVPCNPCGFPAIPGDCRRVDGVGEIVEPKSAGNTGVELLYAVGESIFSAVAPRMVELGWSVFPQEISTERKPGSVFGEMIQWSKIKDAKPDAETLAKWCLHCPTLNVACVFGPASGHTFAVDIDVEDEDMSDELAELADEILGYTPFRRVGKAPKIALIYRHAADDVVATRRRTFEASTDDCKKGIEILGAGSLLTFHGRHHSTGTYFKWLGGKGSLIAGPDAAPLVTSAQVDEFMAAADARWKLKATFSGAGAGGVMAWGTSEGIRVPQIRHDADVQRNGEGLIQGSREEYLRSLVWSVVVVGNRAAFHAAKAAGPKAIEEFKANCGAAIVQEFTRCAATDGRWRIGALHTEVGSRVSHVVAKALSGAIEIREPTPENARAAATKERRDALPRIRLVAGEIERMVDEAEAAMITSGRGVYQRGGAIIALGRVDTRTTDGLVSVPVIRTLSEDAVYEEMSSSAVFETWNAEKEKASVVNPPKQVVKSFLARKGRWRLPVLDAIVTAPTLRADGSVLSEPGYDSDTGLFFDPVGVEFPEVAESPTREDAEGALAILWGAVHTFPFVADVDRAVALAAMLTAPVRRNFANAPVFAYSATTAGSGKTKLANIVGAIATGTGANLVSQGYTEEETAKILGGALLKGAPVICMDNCDKDLGGSFMELMLTTEQMDVRPLGSSLMMTVSTNALLTATGNNLVIAKDMTRRVMLAHLDPGVDRPELREFDFEPVAEAKRQRPALVWAALTILRAFHVAGRPRQAAPLSSFEAWSGWVRDALMWLGQADACLSIEAARETDPKLEALSAIQTQWRLALGEERVSVRQVIDTAAKKRAISQWEHEFTAPDFREALLAVAGDGGAINGKRLGKWLGAHAGRIVDGHRLEKAGVLEGVTQWRLAHIS